MSIHSISSNHLLSLSLSLSLSLISLRHTLHYSEMDLDIALRKFLFQFRIPGEAAIIDRILEKFAERYFSQNSDTIFQSADTAYVMSFSIMMLSTDLHRFAFVVSIVNVL
jgi:hypothetical protein